MEVLAILRAAGIVALAIGVIAAALAPFMLSSEISQRHGE